MKVPLINGKFNIGDSLFYWSFAWFLSYNRKTVKQFRKNKFCIIYNKHEFYYYCFFVITPLKFIKVV